MTRFWIICRRSFAVGTRSYAAQDGIVRNRTLDLPPLDTATPFDTTVPLDTVDVARDMLAQLKRDGFGTSIPSSHTVSSTPRRRTRRKTDLGDFDSQPVLLSFRYRRALVEEFQRPLLLGHRDR
jgi:hypothetical protein